jgi:hypothetical protein
MWILQKRSLIFRIYNIHRRNSNEFKENLNHIRLIYFKEY